MAISKEEARKEIEKFLDIYKKHLKEGRFEDQNEANTEKYVELLFEKLGWDRLTDLERQHKGKEGRVDYSINLNDNECFFMEVKKHKEKLEQHKKQAINYALQSGIEWVILTNLRELIVYNSQYRGMDEDVVQPFPPIKIDQFLDRFDDLWVLSKIGAEKNLIESRAVKASKEKIKEPIIILSSALISWRSRLNKEMKAHPRLNEISGKDKESAKEWVEEAVQMLLNRFIFLRTIEDLEQWRFTLGGVLNEWKEKKDKPLMEHISNYFRSADSKYNAGLFAKHRCEDLTLADHVLEQIIKEMYVNKENDIEWDFKALISNQDILGLAYEQYLGTTLTEKTARIRENKKKRKTMGIYYTPKYIVEYIVKNTLGEKLKECKTLDDILKIKVVDPACGSGSFLKEAYRTFKEEIRKRGWNNQTYLDKETGEHMSSYDAVLKNCIYGVDLDKKACEMAKLNLLIMAAEGGTHRLPDIDKSIQQGDSLIDDASIVSSRLAFKWKERFPDVFNRENPGFDVVIGNPPYVDSEEMTKSLPIERGYISKTYKSAKGNWDLYIPFYERAFNVARNKGYVSFIAPNKWLSIGYGKALRNYLNQFLFKLCSCDEIKVFKDAGNSPVITFFKKEIVKGDILTDFYNEDYTLTKNKPAKRRIIEKDNWGMLISKYLSLLLKIYDNPETISSVCEIENPFSVSEAYELKKIIYNGKNKNTDDFKFINTGTIDKFCSLWGIKNTTYIKEKYIFPYIKKKLFQKIMPKRYDQSTSKKIIISGIRYFECFLDSRGEYVAGKSTLIIRNVNSISMEALTSLLNSNLIEFYLKQVYGTSGIEGGVNFSAPMIKSIPIPKRLKKHEKELEEFYNKIIRNLGKNKKNEPEPYIINQLNQLIYKIYGITEKERRIVEESLKN